MDTIIYIDGFNFYHGCLQGNDSCKWLDFEKFFEAFLKGRSITGKKIVRIKYFTTHIKSYIKAKNGEKIYIPKLVRKKDRQLIYLKALEVYNPKVNKPYYGRFSSYPVELPLANNPDKKVKVIRTEEKMTDVSLATHMLNDAWLDKYECAILVSNDSDMTTAIQLIKYNIEQKEIGYKELGLITPAVNKNREVSKKLKNEVDFDESIKSKWLMEKCQLPDKIPGTEYERPDKWKTEE